MEWYNSPKVKLMAYDSWNDVMLSCFSHVQLFATPWTVAPQAPLSIGILQARKLELSFPPPDIIPTQGSIPRIDLLSHQGSPMLPGALKTRVQSLGRKDLLKKEMATHSGILAWKIPWMEEPGRLQPMGLRRVGHDWVTSLLHSVPSTVPCWGQRKWTHTPLPSWSL